MSFCEASFLWPFEKKQTWPSKTRTWLSGVFFFSCRHPSYDVSFFLVSAPSGHWSFWSENIKNEWTRVCVQKILKKTKKTSDPFKLTKVHTLNLLGNPIFAIFQCIYFFLKQKEMCFLFQGVPISIPISLSISQGSNHPRCSSSPQGGSTCDLSSGFKANCSTWDVSLTQTWRVSPNLKRKIYIYKPSSRWPYMYIYIPGIILG